MPYHPLLRSLCIASVLLGSLGGAHAQSTAWPPHAEGPRASVNHASLAVNHAWGDLADLPQPAPAASQGSNTRPLPCLPGVAIAGTPWHVCRGESWRVGSVNYAQGVAGAAWSVAVLPGQSYYVARDLVVQGGKVTAVRMEGPLQNTNTYVLGQACPLGRQWKGLPVVCSQGTNNQVAWSWASVVCPVGESSCVLRLNSQKQLTLAPLRAR